LKITSSGLMDIGPQLIAAKLTSVPRGESVAASTPVAGPLTPSSARRLHRNLIHDYTGRTKNGRGKFGSTGRDNSAWREMQLIHRPNNATNNAVGHLSSSVFQKQSNRLQQLD